MKLSKCVIIITGIVTIISMVIFCIADSSSKIGTISSGILTGGIVGLIVELPNYFIQRHNEINKIKVSLHESNLFLRQFENFLKMSLKSDIKISNQFLDYYFNNISNSLNVTRYIDNDLYTLCQKRKLLKVYKKYADNILFSIYNEKEFNYIICYNENLIQKMQKNNQDYLTANDMKDYFNKILVNVENNINSINNFAYQFYSKKDRRIWKENNKTIDEKLKEINQNFASN